MRRFLFTIYKFHSYSCRAVKISPRDYTYVFLKHLLPERLQHMSRNESQRTEKIYKSHMPPHYYLTSSLRHNSKNSGDESMSWSRLKSERSGNQIKCLHYTINAYGVRVKIRCSTSVPKN
jgi:hypothetical protein